MLDKGVGLRFASTGAQIRKVPRPAHSYGSPAADLKKEQAEEEARRAAEQAEEQAGSDD